MLHLLLTEQAVEQTVQLLDIWDASVLMGRHSNVWKIQLTSEEYGGVRQWTGSALVQVMACLLLGAKPLTELMLTHC